MHTENRKYNHDSDYHNENEPVLLVHRLVLTIHDCIQFILLFLAIWMVKTDKSAQNLDRQTNGCGIF
jgi:hypothetical protein